MILIYFFIYLRFNERIWIFWKFFLIFVNKKKYFDSLEIAFRFVLNLLLYCVN